MQSKSEKSHLKLLRSKKEDISQIRDDELILLFENFKTKQNVDISDNYKISILRTLKKYNDNITKKPKQLKLKAQRIPKKINVEGKRVIIDIIKNTYNLMPNIISAIESRSLIDTYIAILLVTSCKITIGDLFNLTDNDLKQLVTHQTLTKNKKIIINSYFAQAEVLIRELFNHRNNLTYQKPFNDKLLISCSQNLINKTVKFLCEETAATFKVDKGIFKSMGISKFIFKQPSLLEQFLKIN